MWYAIQTRNGEEKKLKNVLEKQENLGVRRVILPLFEDVWRKGGIGHISLSPLFPGYLFLDAEEPARVDELITTCTSRYNRMLATKDAVGVYYQTVTEEEEAFIGNLIEDGIMHVSFVRYGNDRKRFETIIGPLKTYADRIVKVDLGRRRAIVEANLFGRGRRIKFGLWTDADPKIAWIEEQLAKAS